jgi:acyl-CoA synthetase (AMP-forming)/AMP-acid ligase II
MKFKDITESSQKCPHCGGPLVEYSGLMEKKDACYYKVKASAKVWPSAYASGRLVQCRKKGAANYGNKSESAVTESNTLSPDAVRKLQHKETPFEALKGISFSIDSEHRLQIHAPHLSDSALQTQDVVELLSETSFYYRGRFDRVINSGGVKLFAEVIERKLGALIAEPFQVTSLPDAILGQRVVLYIESMSPVDESALKTKMTTLLDRYEVPKEIRIVKEFERTHSGKIKLIGK